MTNLIQRTITGLTGAFLLVAGILFSPVTFFILFFIITLLSVLEFYRLVSTENIKPQIILGTIISLTIFIFISSKYFIQSSLIYENLTLKLSLIIIISMFLIFFSELYRKSNHPFINIALTITGIIYVALPLSLFTCISFYITNNEYHSHLILGFLLLLWASDVGAYFIGKNFGKHKLFESISPKKTWEGSIGGTAMAVLTAFVISKYFTELNQKEWMIIAFIIVVAGTLGDLVESMLKRSLNIKDSGNILPGHGGMLDRFDGLLGAAPFVFFYLVLFH